MRHWRISLASLLAVWSALFLLVATPVAATVYGEGPYSACPVGQACPTNPPTPTPTSTPTPGPTDQPTVTPTPTPTPAPPTIIETPSGLDFAVNLSNGQVLTPPEYVVRVTPLNGQGRTFAKVEFLVDGTLAFTATPDETGTFTWRWTLPSPPSNPKVGIVLYDGDGQTTRKDIAVRVASATGASPSPSASPKPSTPVAEIAQQIAQSVGETVTSVGKAVSRIAQQIPAPVAYAFPYILFALIGAGLILLVFQAHREVAEAEALAVVLRREKELNQDKATFMQLASHYLRTPLAVMSGGVDVLIAQHALAPTQADGVKRAIDALHTKVENLLGQAVNEEPAVDMGNEKAPGIARVWLRPGFLVPIILMAILTLGFNLLMSRVSNFEVGMVNWLVQWLLFGLLALALYMLLRSRFLRHRQQQRVAHLREEQNQIEATRNVLLAQSSDELGADLAVIKTQLSGLPVGKGTEISRDGFKRFEDVLIKLTTASQLNAVHTSHTAPEAFNLAKIVNGAVATVATQAQAKHLQVQFPEDALITAPQPQWLQKVLASLLDNAVAYSPDGGAVEIAARGEIGATVITVSDNGPGIPADKLPTLFKPFTRADGALVFDHEGMGFSLYLDKLIMGYVGGTIEASAHQPHGLSIAMHFPSA